MAPTREPGYFQTVERRSHLHELGISRCERLQSYRWDRHAAQVQSQLDPGGSGGGEFQQFRRPLSRRACGQTGVETRRAALLLRWDLRRHQSGVRDRAGICKPHGHPRTLPNDRLPFPSEEGLDRRLGPFAEPALRVRSRRHPVGYGLPAISGDPGPWSDGYLSISLRRVARASWAAGFRIRRLAERNRKPGLPRTPQRGCVPNRLLSQGYCEGELLLGRWSELRARVERSTAVTSGAVGYGLCDADVPSRQAVED